MVTQVKNGFISVRWDLNEHLTAAQNIHTAITNLSQIAENSLKKYGANHKITLQSHQIVKRMLKLMDAMDETFWYEHPKEDKSPYEGDK